SGRATNLDGRHGDLPKGGSGAGDEGTRSDVILRAVAKKMTWAQAGEVIGLCERQMRRSKERYEESGYDGRLGLRAGLPVGTGTLPGKFFSFTLPPFLAAAN